MLAGFLNLNEKETMHMADNKQSRVVAEPGELTVKVNVDASDAIRALKAIQREAREATKALRELEALRGSINHRAKGTKAQAWFDNDDFDALEKAQYKDFLEREE